MKRVRKSSIAKSWSGRRGSPSSLDNWRPSSLPGFARCGASNAPR
jgi:hypothetical protein